MFLCQSGFTGVNCSVVDPQCARGYCSPSALCQPGYRGVVNGNERPYCVCPFEHIGQRCELYPNKCVDKPCRNGGICFQRSKPNEYRCECPKEYRGTTCDEPKPFVHLRIEHNANLSVHPIVVQYMKIDFALLSLQVVGQQAHPRLPDDLMHLHDGKTVPEIVVLKHHHIDPPAVHLISVHTDRTFINTIPDLNRCLHARSLFLKNDSQSSSLITPSQHDLCLCSAPSVIKYHSLCTKNRDLLCFFDHIYLCICDDNHSRAECFNYDDSSDKCDRCLANGRCLKGSSDTDVLCICPACREGRLCQFKFESFSFTLDQLFFSDLLSPNGAVRRTTFSSLMIVPLLLFLMGLVNNVCCIVTFRRPRCLRIGTGHYLFWMSICNQCNLAFLALRLIHLTLNISTSHSSPLLNNILCKSSSYLLTTSSRMTYWLGSLIALERVYVAWFVNGQWLKRPNIARRIISATLVTVLVGSGYQWSFVDSQISSDDSSHAMCAMTFPPGRSVWMRVHSAVTIIDSVAPFVINLVCTVTIICIVTKKKMRATGRGNGEHRVNHLRLLRSVWTENKELVIGPAFTLVPQLFSLPYFIASLILRCQNLQGDRLRYLLAVSYLTGFIPQLLSFVLYISPSTFYLQEWRATTLCQRLKRNTNARRQPVDTVATNTLDMTARARS